MTENNGGPAFPGGSFPEHPHHPNGMSLRDWFAGSALPQAGEDYDRKTRGPHNIKDYPLPWACEGVGTREEIIARQAYRYADAMLKVRGETE